MDRTEEFHQQIDQAVVSGAFTSSVTFFITAAQGAARQSEPPKHGPR